MSEALVRLLRAGSTASCALDCHVVGERGLHDGGFLDVMETLGFQSPRRASCEGMPHALQRLGGVRCTSCHGPGAIPEPGDSTGSALRSAPPATTHRSTILSADWTRSRWHARIVPPRQATLACALPHDGWVPRRDRRSTPSRITRSRRRGRRHPCAACRRTRRSRRGARALSTCHPPRRRSRGPHQERELLCATCHAPTPDETFLRIERRSWKDAALPVALAVSKKAALHRMH
jgi:hypothetical protein